MKDLKFIDINDGGGGPPCPKVYVKEYFNINLISEGKKYFSQVLIFFLKAQFGDFPKKCWNNFMYKSRNYCNKRINFVSSSIAQVV